MRNHIVFKFIAVVLCAACLLGAIGSGIGIFALTSMDLYDKTVEQVYQERIDSQARNFADELAMEYTSKTLGGFTDSMMESVTGMVSGYYRHDFEYNYFGYTLKDYEGNVLDSQELNYPEGAVTYTYDITGQYMHLVDVIPHSEQAAQQSDIAAVDADGVVLYDAVPPEGAAVGRLTITLENRYCYDVQEDLGVAFYNADGILQFHCVPWAVDADHEGETVEEIVLYGRNGEMLYHANSAAGVGRIDWTNDGSTLLFTSDFSQEPAERYLDAPYDVLINDIPAEGAILSEIQISTADSSSGASGGNLGTVFCNQDGVVILRCPGFDLGETDSLVTAIALHDNRGVLIYEASAEDGVGLVAYSEDGTGDMIFTSFRPYESDTALPVTEPAAEETVPVTTAPAETVPETTAVAETEAAEETQTTEAAEASEASGEETSEEKKASKKEKPEEKQESSEDVKSEEKQEASKEEKSEEKQEAVPAAAAAEDAEAEPAAEGTEVTEAPTETAVAETIPEETIPEETVPEETEPLMINGKRLDSYQINRTEYYDSQLGETATAKYVYVPMPAMTVELRIAPGALRYDFVFTLLRSVRTVRGYLLPALGICLLLFAVFAVYLCCAAGRKPKSDEIQAGGLNRMPLDLYGGLAFLGICALCVVIAELGDDVLRQNVLVGSAFAAAMGYFACLLFVGFCFAFVAQVKMPGGFWLRNSLCGWCLKLCAWLLKQMHRWCVRLEEWINARGWPMLKRLIKWIWSVIAAVWLWFWNTLKRIYNWMYSGFSRIYDLLPITWQWILSGGILVLLIVISIAAGSLFLFWLSILMGFALVLYGAHCFGSLMEATRKMNKGDLNSKADDKLMVGAFKDFAHDLNDLAGVAVVAAQKQLKSERMKTELITNVSHDIKTPLTSIFNYVDLLQKPHTEEEGREYLEVLDRQSQRLKKLIEDLMDMSKASTGNMAVDITIVDAVESVNQALGEFADKLEKVRLTPVFRHTEESVSMLADGRLVWRVLSNLLGNAVKYAMPGTRLYIDLMSLEDKVVISLKNISRDELNVAAEELMERFVRGDDSRNTEGSGLGLNIAKSLMELQKGQLQLLVDGDLFKVTLIFPGA
nr:HAMP domain-containing histidine kinase [Oscillospiraceae bacterium]